MVCDAFSAYGKRGGDVDERWNADLEHELVQCFAGRVIGIVYPHMSGKQDAEGHDGGNSQDDGGCNASVVRVR